MRCAIDLEEAKRDGEKKSEMMIEKIEELKVLCVNVLGGKEIELNRRQAIETGMGETPVFLSNREWDKKYDREWRAIWFELKNNNKNWNRNKEEILWISKFKME